MLVNVDGCSLPSTVSLSPSVCRLEYVSAAYGEGGQEHHLSIRKGDDGRFARLLKSRSTAIR
jgi:hypothetical protein